MNLVCVLGLIFNELGCEAKDSCILSLLNIFVSTM